MPVRATAQTPSISHEDPPGKFGSLSHTHTRLPLFIWSLLNHPYHPPPQGSDPPLVYQPNLDKEAKEKEEYRNFEVSLNILNRSDAVEFAVEFQKLKNCTGL